MDINKTIRIWRHKNPDKVKKYLKKYYSNNPNKIKQINDNYRIKHKDKINTDSKARYYAKKYENKYQNNKDYQNFNQAKDFDEMLKLLLKE